MEYNVFVFCSCFLVQGFFDQCKGIITAAVKVVRLAPDGDVSGDVSGLGDSTARSGAITLIVRSLLLSYNLFSPRTMTSSLPYIYTYQFQLAPLSLTHPPLARPCLRFAPEVNVASRLP